MEYRVPKIFWAIILFLSLLFPLIAQAQIIPNSATPEGIERQFRPVAQPNKRLHLIINQLNNAQIPTEVLENEVFTLSKLDIIGVHILDQSFIDALYAQVPLDTKVTAAQIVKINNQLTKAYANAGYPRTVVYRPLYGLVGNKVEVRIEVVEASVGEVVWPEHLAQQKRYQYWSKKLKEETPIPVNTEFRYKTLAQELPGLGLNAVDRPSDEVGLISMEFTEQNTKKLGLSAGVNNRGTEATGPYQTTLGAVWQRPTGLDDRLTLNYSGTTDWGEQHYGYAQYDHWVGYEGTVLSLYGSLSRGEPGTDVLQNLEYKSDGVTAGIKATHPFWLSEALDIRGFVALEFNEFKSELLDTTNSHDQVTFLKLGQTMRFNDNFLGRLSAENSLSLTFSQGLKNAWNFGNDNPNASRGDGRVDFSKVMLDYKRKQALAKSLNLTLEAKLQKTYDPLLSSQECGYGGSQFGRGYDSSALIGDDCALLSAELAFALPIQNQMISNAEIFTFADYGKVWQWGGDDSDAMSWGVGLRSNFFRNFDFSVELVKPKNDLNIDDDWRGFFSVGARW